MLYSMTGYGRAEQTIGDRIFIVEIKSLNGKQFDLRMLTPQILKPFEIEIRNKYQDTPRSSPFYHNAPLSSKFTKLPLCPN